MKTGTTWDTEAMTFYLGLVTAKFYETWDFYTERLAFRTVEEDDHRVLLEHASGARLAILRQEIDEQHAELVSATEGRGFWLNLDVVDVDAAYQSLCETDVPVVQPLDAGPCGERFFMVRDPNGVLIRIGRGQAIGSKWAVDQVVLKDTVV